MNAAPIRLSVALLARNRPESLDRALQSVRAQSLQPTELLVSDNSDPEYASAIAAVAHRWDARYLLAPVQGLYANRNFAACACIGSHIHTMDDDHVWPAGHLETCLAAVRRDPGAIWTMGEIGFIDGEFYCTVDRANQLSPSGVGIGITNPEDNWGIADGATIYPRTVFDRGFRMLETFGGYGESYLEFGAYLYHNGFTSKCIPHAPIEHYAPRSTITRRPVSMYASRLYASLCYNGHFRPNAVLLWRYMATYSWYLRDRYNPLSYVPQVVTQVRDRWQAVV